MRLYAGLSTHFIRDTVHNQIAEKLKTAYFEYYRCQPSASEIQSWRNSLRASAQVFEEAGLKDHGVLLEYQLPLTSRRLDCMITGRNGQDHQNAVVMELKQWEGANAAIDDERVSTWSTTPCRSPGRRTSSGMARRVSTSRSWTPRWPWSERSARSSGWSHGPDDCRLLLEVVQPTQGWNALNDVVIGDYRRPWNAKSGYRTAPGIPKESLWATEKGLMS